MTPVVVTTQTSKNLFDLCDTKASLSARTPAVLSQFLFRITNRSKYDHDRIDAGIFIHRSTLHQSRFRLDVMLW